MRPARHCSGNSLSNKSRSYVCHGSVISSSSGFLIWDTPNKETPPWEPPFKLLKSINFGGCSSGGWFFLRVLGLETTQQIHSLGGGGFLQSNTHNQFWIKTLFMIWWLSKERSVFKKKSTLTEKSKMFKERFVTKIFHKKTQKNPRRSLRLLRQERLSVFNKNSTLKTEGCYSGGDSLGAPGCSNPRVLRIPTISFQ